MKKLIAFLLAMLLLLAGCGKSPGPEEPAAPAQTVVTQPRPANTAAVSLAVEQEAGFDPYNCRSSCNRLVLELVLQPLFTVSAKGEAMPMLAKGWSVSTDGMTTTVYLRPDIAFHNGRPLTAADVVTSVNRAKEGTFYQGRFRYLTEVSAANDSAVVFKTEKAYENFTRLLDIPIVSGNETMPAGTGPYCFDGNAGLKRADSWKAAYPSRAETIGFVPVTDAVSLRDGFHYGGVSAAWLDPNAPSALAYNGDYELWSVPTSILQYVGFNLESGPFASGGLRSAVTYAIDRTAIIREDMDGAGVAATLAALPGSGADSAELSARVVYDPQKTKSSITPAPDASPAVMIVSVPGSQRARSAQRIADALTDCGIPVTVKALEQDDFRTALQEGDFDLYYAEVKLSPDLDLAPLFGSLGYGGLNDHGDMVTLCDLARANVGNTYDLQKAILTDGLFVPVAFKQMELYIHRDVLDGVSPHLNGWLLK